MRRREEEERKKIGCDGSCKLRALVPSFSNSSRVLARLALLWLIFFCSLEERICASLLRLFLFLVGSEGLRATAAVSTRAAEESAARKTRLRNEGSATREEAQIGATSGDRGRGAHGALPAEQRQQTDRGGPGCPARRRLHPGGGAGGEPLHLHHTAVRGALPQPGGGVRADAGSTFARASASAG